MPNLFDGKRDAMYDIVSETMGYIATWTPSNDTVQQSTRVLFNDPVKTQKLTKMEYGPNAWSMEYRKPFFVNLDTLVWARQSNEVVTIEGQDYYVRDVTFIHDGNTCLGILEIKL